MSNSVERNYGPMPRRSWRCEVYTWTDLTEENVVDISNQRTCAQNLAVVTISLTDIAAEGWPTTVD